MALLPITSEIAERTRRRITRRLMPFLFVLYIIAFLDRINVSFAGLEMTRELGFSNEVFGFGAGIFFIGYVVLEIPGTLFVELWSARKWISRILISWGLVAALNGFIHTSTQFYWARFLLGVAEAGFFPGVVVYLTHWYRYEDRGKAVASFMSAIPISQILGAPISGLLMKIHWLGWSGWRWLFILEGLPAVIFGVITLFYLTDRPSDAKWLPDEERDWITGELERERLSKESVRKLSVWQAFRNRDVILLTAAYFLGANVQYGFGLWLPKILQRLSGLSSFQVVLVSAIPFLFAWPAMLLIGASSDRTGERRWHTALPLFAAGIALAISQWKSGNVVLGIVMFTIAAMGINGRLPSFWALPTTFLTGASAAACIGAINCIGNIGGFAGPYIVGRLSSLSGNYLTGVFYLVGSAMLGGLLTLLVRARPRGAA